MGCAGWGISGAMTSSRQMRMYRKHVSCGGEDEEEEEEEELVL